MARMMPPFYLTAVPRECVMPIRLRYAVTTSLPVVARTVAELEAFDGN